MVGFLAAEGKDDWRPPVLRIVPKPGATDWRVRKVLDFAAAHLREPLTLHRLAGVAGVSPDHLSRLFREAGMAVRGSIKSMRLDAAARLLLDAPELGMQQVAATVGFRDKSNFSRAFKARFGIAPTAYRNSARDTAVATLFAESAGARG